MDIHQSRAECMVRLGDISNGHSNVLTALELWEAAKPLFERSSQSKQVQSVDERLERAGGQVLERYEKNLACLVVLNAPAGMDEEPGDLEPDLHQAKGSRLISA
jgi:hypothetical protein